MDERQQQIDEFIARNGVTRCPTKGRKTISWKSDLGEKTSVAAVAALHGKRSSGGHVSRRDLVAQFSPDRYCSRYDRNDCRRTGGNRTCKLSRKRTNSRRRRGRGPHDRG